MTTLTLLTETIHWSVVGSALILGGVVLVGVILGVVGYFCD